MKKLAIIFLLLSSFTPTVIAIPYDAYGPFSCGSFLENHRKDNLRNKMQISWIVGMVTGINLKAAYNGQKQIELLDGNAAVYYVLKYCKENPLDSSSNALEALMLEQ